MASKSRFPHQQRPGKEDVLKQCLMQLNKQDDGYMSDDCMQLLAFIFEDVGLCTQSTAMQLNVLALSILSSMDVINKVVRRQLLESRFPLMKEFKRLTGTIFMEEKRHYMSFETSCFMESPQAVCRNLTLYDSLLPVGFRKSFICRLHLCRDDDDGSGSGRPATRPSLMAFMGEFTSKNDFESYIPKSVQVAIARLIAFLEVYYAWYNLMAQGIPHPSGSLPNPLKPPHYLVTLMGHATVQTGNDCGIFALAHRQQLLQGGSDLSNATNSSGVVAMQNNIPLKNVATYMEQRLRLYEKGCPEYVAVEHLIKQVQGAFRNELVGIGNLMAGQFSLPEPANVQVYDAGLLRNNYKNMLGRNWLPSQFRHYAAFKAVEWTLTRLLCPQRSFDDGSTAVPWAGRPKIVVECDVMSRNHWTQWINYFLISRGLMDKYDILSLEEMLERIEGPGDGHYLDTPVEVSERETWESVELFLNITGWSNTPSYDLHGQQQARAAMHRCLCINARRCGTDNSTSGSRFALLNLQQQDLSPYEDSRPVFTHVRDWITQVISTVAFPSKERPYFFTTEPPFGRSSYLVEHDRVDMRNQGYFAASEGIPTEADMTAFPTRLYAVGWDAQDPDRFFA